MSDVHYTTMKAKDLPEAITDKELKHWQIRHWETGEWSETGKSWDDFGAACTREDLTCDELLRTAKQVPGQWYSSKVEGTTWPILYCVGYAPDGTAIVIDSDHDLCDLSIVGEHLPDCTGFDWVEPKPTVIVDGPGVYESESGGIVILDNGMKNPLGDKWREDGTTTHPLCVNVVRKIDAMPETMPEGYRLTSPPQFDEPNGRPFLSAQHSKPTVLKTNNIVRSINKGRRWIVEPLTKPTLEQLGEKIAELVKACEKLKGKGRGRYAKRLG